MRSEAAMRVPHLRLVRPGELSPAAKRARAERRAKRMLLTAIAAVVLLTGAGLVMVLSASSVSAFTRYGSSFLFFKRQLLYAVAGGVVAVGTSRIPYRFWQKAWLPMLGLTLLLLGLVLHPSIGTVAGGSARWLMVGPISVQPSELAKFVVVCGAASILAANMRYLNDPILWLVPLAAVVGPVAVLILMQPDLGTMMIVSVTVLGMMFLAGVRLRLLLVTTVLGGAAGMLLIFGEGYRKSRFLSFLDPFSDPSNTGYQIVQSLIALGSGHLVGVGLGASRQKWMYVPNAHTDFIFSILGEELGLIGELVVLAAFCAFVYAGFRIALAAPDAFGRLLAAGITTWIGLQALVNLGAVTGVLPITGVPLPFMSFGGSALVVSLGAVGVLVSVARAGAAGPKPAKGRRVRQPVPRG